MKLLYREKQYIDESFSGYVARLSYWNGFKSEYDFISWLLRIYKELFYGCELNYDGRLTVRVSKDHDVSKRRKSSIALEAVLGRSFSWSEMNVDEVKRRNYRIQDKICSLCWAEAQYIRFYWLYSRYTVCHKHDILLLPMRNISYDPLFNIYDGVDQFTIISRYSNCELTQKFLRFRGESACSAYVLRAEISVIRDEIFLWQQVILFLKERFFILFEFEDVFDSFDHESLFGTPVVERIEKVREHLVIQRPEFEKLIYIVVILHISKYWVYFQSKDSWLASEAYSLKPVFYSYMFGVGQHLFARGVRVSLKVMPPIPFQKFSDQMLCKFILESSILNPSDLLSVQHEGKSFNTVSGEDQIYDYKSYIEATGNNIFDRELCHRSELPELN